jgi:hypothetical protein
VIVGPTVADASWVQENAKVNIQGRVQPVTEADLNTWVQNRTLVGEARSMAAFATHYLLVEQMR